MYKNYAILQTNDNLRRRHILLYLRRAICVIISHVQQCSWRCTNPWRRLEEIKHWCLAHKTPSSPSESPHNSLSNSCCSLLVSVSVLKHLDASFSQSKSLGQLQNSHGTILRLKLWFLSFLKSALLHNFGTVVEHELLIVRVQRPWFNIFGMGTNDVSAEWRKSGDGCISASHWLESQWNNYPNRNFGVDPSPQCFKRNITYSMRQKKFVISKMTTRNRRPVRCHEEN
jgi:hypothetical protein